MLLQPQHVVETGPRVPRGSRMRLLAPAATATDLQQLLTAQGLPVDFAAEAAGWVEALDDDAGALHDAAVAAMTGQPLKLDSSPGSHELAVGLLRPALAGLAAQLEQRTGVLR